MIHQQIALVPQETDADVIVLSFLSGFAPEVYRLGRTFRQHGKVVVAGDPYATFAPDEVECVLVTTRWHTVRVADQTLIQVWNRSSWYCIKKGLRFYRRTLLHRAIVPQDSGTQVL